MGLSVNERTTKIYYAISGLVKTATELQNRSKDYYERELVKTLVDYTTKFWHAFLAENTNSAMWLLGSDAAGAVPYESNYPWSTAIQATIQDEVSKHDSFIYRRNEEDKEFNAKDWCSMNQALPSPQREIFQIYLWNESISYPLRRYDDEYLKSYEELSKLVSNVYGTCFSLFAEDEVFAKGYLIQRIAGMLFSKDYPYKKDDIDKFLGETYMHHEIVKLYNQPLAELIGIHLYLTNNPDDRLFVCAKYFKINNADLFKNLVPAKEFQRLNHAMMTREPEKEETEERENPELGVYGYWFHPEDIKLPCKLGAKNEKSKAVRRNKINPKGRSAKKKNGAA